MSLPKVKDFVQTMELVMMVIVIVHLDITDSIVKKVGLKLIPLQWNVNYPNINHPNSQLSEQAMRLLTQQFFLFFFFFFFFNIYIYQS